MHERRREPGLGLCPPELCRSQGAAVPLCAGAVVSVCPSSTNWLQLCHVNGTLCLEAVVTV